MRQIRTDLSSFGVRLRIIRKERGLSMGEFCEQFNKFYPGGNLSKSAVSRWEAGTREPLMSNVQALSEFFGVSPSWLLGHTDDRDSFVDDPPKFVKDEYIDSLTDAFRRLSVKNRAKLLAYAWDLLDEEGKA